MLRCTAPKLRYVSGTTSELHKRVSLKIRYTCAEVWKSIDEQLKNLKKPTFLLISSLLSPFLRLNKNDVYYNQQTVQTNLWLMQLAKYLLFVLTFCKHLFVSNCCKVILKNQMN